MKQLKTVVIGAQMLCVAFGALVLVPLLTGLDPALALFAAGIATLIFQGVTGAMVPIFLGSSFAFIAPIRESIGLYGISSTLGALAVSGLAFCLLALCFKIWGLKFLDRFLPRIVTGPVIIVIGLKLAPTATASSVTFGSGFDSLALIAAIISLLTAVIINVSKGRFIKLVSILAAVAAGYLFCLILGKVDFSPVVNAPWFAIPWTSAIEAGKYAIPSLSLAAILFIVPVAIAPSVEHIGDIIVISSVTGKDFLKKPGLHRTLLGDGIGTMFAALAGGPPSTTYSEVTGAVALTKAFNPVYMRVAAIFAVILAFCGKLNALLQTIPSPVMGGIMMLLFGAIAAIGINSLVEAKVNLTKPRNLIIAALILTIGIGDLQIFITPDFVLSGIGLSAIAGIILNLIIPRGGKDEQVQ
ncbi:MAG: uracil-xanthine permease family protein [Elusimicrobiota bacterium]|jgi:uracil permease|nr:uracil-xanthine permease family protein [Elusimicrobiota bacterium]